MQQQFQPETEQRLLEIIESCRENSHSVQIEGKGSKSLCHKPRQADVKISTLGLSQIVSYKPEELVLTVQAGASDQEVERLLKEKGQLLPFEPLRFVQLPAPDQINLQKIAALPTMGTIGGMVATGLSGARRFKVGGLRDYLLGARFISGHAQLCRSGGQVMKNVTGYDIPKLMAGSWGELGIMSEVSFKTLPASEKSLTLLCFCADQAQMLALLAKLRQSLLEISGLAALPSLLADQLLGGKASENSAEWVVLCRLKGAAEAVSVRLGQMQQLLTNLQTDLIDDMAHSQMVWRVLRTPQAMSFWLAGQKAALWRATLPPSELQGYLQQITQADLAGRYWIDWAGGAVWLALPATSDPLYWQNHLRDHLPKQPAGGQVQQILRSEAQDVEGVEMRQPQQVLIERLNENVRLAFDPKGLFGGGADANRI